MATIKRLKRKKGPAYQLGFTDPVTKRWTKKTLWCSRDEAEMIRREVEKRLTLGEFNMGSPLLKFARWSALNEAYLEHSHRNKSPKTVSRERDVVKAFTAFLGGDIRISDITTSTIETYRNHRLDRDVKPATVSIELRILKTIFNYAIEQRMAGSNPVKGVALPKPDVIKVRFLRQSEILQLLDVIEQANDPLFKSLILTYLHTGARRYELLEPQFTWANVDFDERRIMLKGKGQRTRFIPMNDTLVNILSALREQEQDPPFPYHPDTVTHRASHYLKLAGIEEANLHSLRKTFGSLLLQNRLADLYTVSRLLGHSTIRTTERYYVDLLDENYRAPVSGLDSIISG